MSVMASIEDGALRIDLDALADNYRQLADRVAPARIAAVVKADAYGLGAAKIAATLAAEGCTDFFVAQLSEAITLKPALPPTASVYILNGIPPGAEEACAAIGAIPVLNSLDDVARWSNLAGARGCRLPAILQVDSGMSRLGLPPCDFDRLMQERGWMDDINLKLIMSHFACADQADESISDRQVAAFSAMASHVPGVPRSLDNSGGAFHRRDEHFDLVRAGIALYGGAPRMASTNPMRPVIGLHARIIQLRDVAAGTGVGYGLTFRAERPSRIATVAIGYADGWPRHLSNRGAGYVGGVRAPIVGRVSMDSITLDVTDVPDVLLHPGALVEMLGPNQTIDDVAADANTISYEILTRLGHRYAREYIADRAAAVARSVCA